VRRRGSHIFQTIGSQMMVMLSALCAGCALFPRMNPDAHFCYRATMQLEQLEISCSLCESSAQLPSFFTNKLLGYVLQLNLVHKYKFIFILILIISSHPHLDHPCWSLASDRKLKCFAGLFLGEAKKTMKEYPVRTESVVVKNRTRYL
jgi:hypothetical protein